ncbi:dihydrolipoamide dehydrogenase [Paenibacillus darwinianus]|uniref:Dihydrolipoyl dehydrogenase n=1 Tax=Paenibacillus darwinianus TaxID=1380763 RepID=A0A9W5W7N8_9BACL|nr:dihydrolipoyl dehydrogenase [Paenibacillus darwinianus]EXX88328.1 dihydrolipoamide dehydrogenase [Paenibacillus darwinianus]EXX88640.1 dihydrolipoamide dehydrogenase [Paenibacillus darwinianus]EXX91834.1 dihydrolipoamide dehydrogenase [Paenibacillus darwinianus]
MTIQVDVAVLGGGPGGYTAAIRAAQLGKKTAIIELDKLGGTCLHRGCIPSKSLLRSAEVYHTVKDSQRYGIVCEGEASVRYDLVSERKRQTVDQLHRGLQYLMKKHDIDIIHGKGRIVGPSIFSPRSGALAVELPDGEMETVVSKNLIVATGSRPKMLPGLPYDGIHIMNSDDALAMSELPGNLLIIGGGVIGVEWASMMNDFGVQVTLVETASRLLPGEDADVSAELEKLLRRRGVRVLTSARLLPDTCEVGDGGVTVNAETAEGKIVLTTACMLVSIGREANVEGLGLEATDIQTQDGFIRVNAHMQTTEPHIYAIGDVIGGVQLAHAAAHEGIAAVEHMTGMKHAPIEAHRIPRCVYSRPEVASIGWTESQARAKGHEVKTVKMPFQAIGKAIVLGETDGFVKVVADCDSGDALGVHMIGPHVTDLISEAGLADLLNASVWELGQLIHPHPTLSEALGEAMLAIDGQALVF